MLGVLTPPSQAVNDETGLIRQSEVNTALVRSQVNTALVRSQVNTALVRSQVSTALVRSQVNIALVKSQVNTDSLSKITCKRSLSQDRSKLAHGFSKVRSKLAQLY